MISSASEMFFHRSLFLSLAAFCLISTSAFGATLPKDEVEALRDIAKTIGKTDWNFSVDPCSGALGWTTKNPVKGRENAVTCNCSVANDALCHVVSIVVKSQNLSGVLPPELVRLPFLQEIDLTRNCLSGPIPSEWGTLKLTSISLIGNRLTGQIPKELADISTLTSLTMEFNQFSGSLPPELGYLPRLERFLISSNYFTGELPETFAKLTTLKDFRISDNNFTGQIPDFIQNFTNLTKLVIQASGLVGPIPSGIAALTNISDLRISDLNGPEAPFPPLGNVKNMHTLILRSCNTTGQLPEYLGQMTKLQVLDLSFNKLSGEIRSSFTGLSNVPNLYLTGNLLTGTEPRWMLGKGNIDLSYNKFTSTEPSRGCQHQTMNLFASSSNDNNSGGIVSCLRSVKCQRTYYSLHINCGGIELPMVNGNTFEEDINGGGPSNFFESRSNWAFSNTGHFLDDERTTKTYIWTNTTRLMTNDSQLYMQARLSPISLTYYGFCMGNGNYTVNLHFAEIMFTDNKTYSSLGRRIFDIYIQGKLELKDFNIEDEAGGVGKAITKNFTTAVRNNTLEIRLYWAGKGTVGIPVRSVYGPLISAISVNPNFKPPSSSSVSVGTVVGIVAGVVILIILVLAILWWKGCLRPKSKMDLDLKGLDLHTSTFTLRQIKAATNNFDPEYKIGEGGFGPVYKGLLADGSVIAVKQLSSKSKQGNREFVNEIGMISALQHPHLVQLYGCCIEGNQLLLVYEYLENNSLARALFGPKEHQLNLDWPTRHRICVGVARGLAYLHEESRLKIVHRDIKATNVLLDKNLNPKISDFGLAKLDEEDNTHISTRVAGTFGYMAPEYAMRGYLTDKADVYSFGIVALEIVSGRSNNIYQQKDNAFYLLDWAHVLKRQGKLMELVDPRLGSDFNEEEVMVMINVALLCSNVSPSIRPTMSTVVSTLEGRVAVQDFVPDSAVSADEETKSEAIRKYYQFNKEQAMNSDQSQPRSISLDANWIASSSSAADLYPINLDSEYFKGRN